MMQTPLWQRRYLTNFDSRRIGHALTDCLVIGGGVAGLSAALEAAKHAQVIVLLKGDLESSATFRAQGGVASVRHEPDTVEAHIRDTLTVGAGLNRLETVEQVCREGVDRVSELIQDGLPFDRAGDAVALGLEGGHSHARIVHAGGDATGRELVLHLGHRLTECGQARVFAQCFVIDLLTLDGACVGAVTYHPKYGHQLIWAKRTILASGGYSRLFRETTNPPGITGDGMAAAFRAGARIADMELVQFHPTTLYVAGSSRALVSEAVRGEGAYLVDKSGERFMPQYHPDAELAPRDVVSRAIVDRLKQTHATSVFLDVRHLGRDKFAHRFPTILERCQQFGIDPATDLIPVRPAAHFTIGGVVTDLQARTNIGGLYCCGEASCTGLHGANRLASNSLLEGLVMGRRAGGRAGREAADGNGPVHTYPVHNENERSPTTMLDLDDVRNSLRSVMWRNAGIVRDGDRLAETLEIVEFWSRFVLDKTFDDPRGWEVQNMLTLSRMLAKAALDRRESRGVHFRPDCPDKESDAFAFHIAFTNSDDPTTPAHLGLDLTSVTGR